MKTICLCGREVEQARVDILGSNVCSVCAKRANPAKVKGIMVWNHKTAPTLQLTSAAGFAKFKKDTDRKGQKSILRSQSPAMGRAL